MSTQTRLTTIVFGCIGYFLIAIIAVHFLRSNLNFSVVPLKFYAVGPYGFLMVSAYFSLGLGSMALVVALYRDLSGSTKSRIGLGLLGLWGVGILFAGIFPAHAGGSTVPHTTTVLIAGIFPVNMIAQPETAASAINGTALYFSYRSLVLATLLLSWHFKQDRKWRPFQRRALVLSIIILGSFTILLLLDNFVLPNSREFRGIGERLFIMASLIWLFFTAIHLRVAANTSLRSA